MLRDNGLLRVLSYNIHKGFSVGNLRFTLHRIRTAMREVEPDLVFLQEVLGRHDRYAERRSDWPETGPLEELADQHWPHFAYGRNAVSDGRHHGNAILSRHPILAWNNFNISQHAVERRGILSCTVDGGSQFGRLHCFCLHLGLLGRWRARQAEGLCTIVEQQTSADDAVIVAGDFNDWRNRLSSPLQHRLGMQDALQFLGTTRRSTYPVVAPIFDLDRIYFRGLEPVAAHILRGHPWRTLSDHAAVCADFALHRA